MIPIVLLQVMVAVNQLLEMTFKLLLVHVRLQGEFHEAGMVPERD